MVRAYNFVEQIFVTFGVSVLLESLFDERVDGPGLGREVLASPSRAGLDPGWEAFLQRLPGLLHALRLLPHAVGLLGLLLAVGIGLDVGLGGSLLGLGLLFLGRLLGLFRLRGGLVSVGGDLSGAGVLVDLVVFGLGLGDGATAGNSHLESALEGGSKDEWGRSCDS